MKKITLLDGGMGQELLRRSSRPVTPMWSADIMLNEPELVRDLHVDFIKCGARVITLNNYTATPERLTRECALEHLSTIHTSAMCAARQAIDIAQQDNVQIAGCLPPLVASYRPEFTLSFEQSLNSYRRLVELQTPQSDIFLCETMASVAEATAACTAAKESGKPVWVGLTVSDTCFGKLRSGESVQAAINALERLDCDAILLNCSQPEAISASLPQLATTSRPFGAYANGFVSISALHPGGTVDALESRQDLDPQQYAAHAMHWLQQGATIVGGCCEIGPTHIKAIHDAMLLNGLIA